MTRNVALPHKLYKFRPFEVHSLELLTDAKVHYSNPMKFNDPLDCRPTIELDVSRADLMRIAHSWLAPAEIDDLHTSGPDAEDIEGVEAWLNGSLRDRLQAKLYSEFRRQDRVVYVRLMEVATDVEPLCGPTSGDMHRV